jgi:hypothetical protein
MKKLKEKTPLVRDRARKCDDIHSKDSKGAKTPGDRGACESETTTQGSE